MGLESAISDYQQADYSDAASVLVSLNDVHCNYARFEQACEQAKSRAAGKKAVVVLSDIFEHRGREKVYQHFKAKDPFEMQVEYVGRKLEGEDREIFKYVAAIDRFGGIDQYIALVKKQMPSFDGKKARQEYEKVKQIFENNIAQRIKLTEREQKELGEMLRDNQVRLQSVDRAIDRYQAKGFADIMNAYKDDLHFIINPGNHDSVLGISAIYEQLKDKACLQDANRIRGTIKVGDLKVQMAGNVYGIVNPTDAMVWGEAVKFVYPHMNMQSVVHNISGRHIQEASQEQLRKSIDYVRMTNDGADTETLDVLLLHSEIGTPLGVEKGSEVYPNLDDLGVAYVAVNQLARDGFIVAGHLHSSNEGVNDLGVKTVRHHDVVISKKDGRVQYELLQSDRPYIDVKFGFDAIAPIFRQFYQQMMQKFEEMLDADSAAA